MGKPNIWLLQMERMQETQIRTTPIFLVLGTGIVVGARAVVNALSWARGVSQQGL